MLFGGGADRVAGKSTWDGFLGIGTATGAGTAALSYGVAYVRSLSKASAAEAQGGGGSGESVAEARARGMAAGDSARRASWFAGDPNGGNPVADQELVRRYNAVETRQVLGNAVKDLGSRSLVGALWTAFRNEETGIWDFKISQSDDTFTVGRKILNSGEFGNYFAGYVETSRFSSFGESMSEMVGQAHSLYDDHAFDPVRDVQLIRQGAADYRADYGVHFPETPYYPGL
jgi:hypothetical protein